MHTQSPAGANNYAISPTACSEFLQCMLWKENIWDLDKCIVTHLPSPGVGAECTGTFMEKNISRFENVTETKMMWLTIKVTFIDILLLSNKDSANNLSCIVF